MEDYDDLNKSNDEMVMNNQRRRETALPLKRNTILRADSDLTNGSNHD